MIRSIISNLALLKRLTKYNRFFLADRQVEAQRPIGKRNDTRVCASLFLFGVATRCEHATN